MLTPLEIENKKFSKKALNGYDPEEVDDFLDDLVVDYEKIYKKSNEADDKIEALENDLEKYKKLENTLQNTLLLAQSAAEEVKEVAKKQAEQIVAEAQSKAKDSTQSIDNEIKGKQKEIEDLQKKFDVYKAKMESLLISQLELLKEMNKDD